MDHKDTIESNNERPNLKRKLEHSDDLMRKRRHIIKQIKSLKRKFSNSEFEVFDKPIERPLKRFRYLVQRDFLDVVPIDMIYYGICNFLEIEDVMKLFKLNKELYNMLQYDSFWVIRYVNDYGVNEKVRFPLGDWYTFYKITYNDLKELQSLYDKLTYAIKNNHLALACKIIYNPNFKPNQSSVQELLKLIIQNCDLPFIEQYIIQMKKWLPNGIQSLLNLGLYYSTEFGKIDLCKLFIKNKAQVDPENFGVKPLYTATDKGYYDICKLLIENGAIVDSLNSGNTPLYMATAREHYDIFELLLKNRADVNIICNNSTALFLASMDGNDRFVELLCKNGADVNFQQQGDLTPLYYAVNNNHVNVVKILLKYRARQDLYYKTFSSLYLASKNGNLEIVKLLVEAGTNINYKPRDNQSALNSAVVNKHLSVVEYLLDHGADIETRNEDNFTPLFFACLNKHYDMVELLCQRGARIDVVDKNGSKLYTDNDVNDECRKILDKYMKKSE